jgi:UDP-glucuronate decarboxylase
MLLMANLDVLSLHPSPHITLHPQKRVAETLFFDYHRQHNVEIRVARIFNTYGPGLHPFDGRVVSNFIMQALAGEDITIYGDGSQTRSFCFVDDLIEGLVRLMNQDHVTGPINLGNPHEFTIKQLAELCVELTGSASKVIFLPLPMDDPKKRKPDITLAQTHLDGWTPAIQLKEGLLKTIDYFKQLDMRYFKRPTKHTAHKNSNEDHARDTNNEPSKAKEY